MSIEEENKIVIRHFFDELNKGNLVATSKLRSSEYIFHSTYRDRSLEQWKEMVAHLMAAFPDINSTIEDIIAEGDKVVTRFIIRGTHRGTYWGVAPTGKQLTYTAIEIDRIADGKIVETWMMADSLGLGQQLGAIPSQSKKVLGIPELRAGETIEVEGLGEPFNKDSNVEPNTHTIKGSGYSTKFIVKRNKR